jgi:Tol biopolymer transport system component
MARPSARGGRAPVAALLLVVALVLLPAPARAASYPPHLRFQTVSTDRVSVHFHQGFEPTARLAASMATDILSRHEARYGRKVGRVQIVIVDAEDQPNGFATPVPFPLVTIRAVAPDGTDDFGNHEGWLRLVLTHELAHTVHLEDARGLWSAGRKLLGRAPYLFPNAAAMSWMIEGLATYEETEMTAFGRGRNPDSRSVLRMAALEGRFPKGDQAIYALDRWPGGQTPYLFGEAFLRRLSEQAGDDTIPRMGRQHAGQLPFLDSRTVRKTTGTRLGAQWRAWVAEATADFEREAGERREKGLTGSTPLTARGIRQVSPRFSPDGAWVAYTSQTLTRFPEIRITRPDGSEDRRLAHRNGGSGLAWTPDGRSLVYGELQVFRTFAVHADLSLVDVETGAVRRLTRGARAYDPDVSPDGRTIVFARKMGDRSELHTVSLDGEGLRPLTASAPGVEWSGPRWSPRGDTIVAARLLPGGWLDLVRVDPATGAVEQLTHDRAKDVEPTWTPDGEAVLFRSDRDGVSNVHALRLSDRSLFRVTNVLGGAFDPSVSPDGLSVAYSSYSSTGYDVHVAPLDLAAAPAAPPFEDAHPAPRPDPPPAAGPARPYRPGSMLLPRFWTPWIEGDDAEDRFGFATGGSDALFRHAWAAQATYGTGSERVNASGFYLYDRFRPTLLAAVQDTTDVYTGGRLRTRRLNL